MAPFRVTTPACSPVTAGDYDGNPVPRHVASAQPLTAFSNGNLFPLLSWRTAPQRLVIMSHQSTNSRHHGHGGIL